MNIDYSDDRWYVVHYQGKPTMIKFRKQRSALEEAGKIGGTIKRMGYLDGKLVPMASPKKITVKISEDL